MNAQKTEIWTQLFKSIDDLEGLYRTLFDWLEKHIDDDLLIAYRPEPLEDLPNGEAHLAKGTVLIGNRETPDPISIEQIRENDSGIADLSNELTHFEMNDEWYLSLETDEALPDKIRENKISITQFLRFAGQYHYNRERADLTQWFLRIGQFLKEGREYEELINEMLTLVCEAIDHDIGGFYTIEDNEFRLTVDRNIDVEEHRDRRMINEDKLVELGMGELNIIFESSDNKGKNHLYLPLRIGPELIGIIALYDLPLGPDDLSETKEFTLNALSTVSAIALNNLELSTQLQEKVIHDELSGLKTNEYFRERVHQEIERGQRYGSPSSVLLIDLDRFEEINEKHGHPVGDAVLRELGRVIRNAVRRIDICSRVENDQFGILFPNTTAKDAVNATKRLQEILNTPLMDIHGQDIEVNFSGGLAGFPDDAETVEELFKQVELALYEAKQTGRNRIVTTESVDEDHIEGEEG